MMKGLVLAALLAVGCGGSGTSPGTMAALEGNWIVTLANGCVVGLDFAGSEYAFATICPSASAFNMQEYKGSWSADADTLTLDVAQSTCAAGARSFVETYAVSPTSLKLVDSSGTLLLVPNTASGGSGAATFGCFDSTTGAFTASPLAPR
jgi:hypothetical protein